MGADPSYFMPSAQIHAFMMFAPFLAMWEKRGMLIQGTFLLLTGPVMAAAITPNLMEQASIWCFFSIMQVCVMLILILREEAGAASRAGGQGEEKKSMMRQ